MRLKAKGNLFIVKSPEALKKLLKLFFDNKQEYFLLGLGANQLISSENQTPWIKLKFSFDKTYLESTHKSYILPASVPLSLLSAHAIRFGLKGWEVFTGIPATLGGAVFMNAGTSLGEIASLVSKVKIIDREGNEREEFITSNSFSYRKNHFLKDGDIVTQVTLRNDGQDPAISEKIRNYLDWRNKTQPLKAFTCGCVFKNYHDKEKNIHFPAGKLIDLLGLKGLRLENLKVSSQHANFIENLGEADYGQVVNLIDIIYEELYLQYGVRFETEVKFDKTT